MTIVALKTERAAINEAAVELLERALEEVRDGRIVAVGIAVVRPGGGINVGHTPSDIAGPLLGAAVLLQHRIIANLE